MKTHNFTLCNVDTDSISFCKPDHTPFTPEEQLSLLADLNSHFPEKIKWAHDGFYERFIVVKKKNYILSNKWHFKNGNYELDPKSGLKLKGSSMKSSKTEPVLKEFMKELVQKLVNKQPEQILSVYQKYIKMASNIQDIKPWCSKKTVTESVLNPIRTTEQKIFDALKDKTLQMGDKYYFYFKNDEEKSLVLAENWNGDHHVPTLYKRIHDTLTIFENILDLKEFPKYHLKGKKVQKQLKELLSV